MMAQRPGIAIISHRMQSCSLCLVIKTQKIVDLWGEGSQKVADISRFDTTKCTAVYLARNIQTIIFHLFARTEGGHRVSSEEFLVRLSNIFFKETRLHDLTLGRGRGGVGICWKMKHWTATKWWSVWLEFCQTGETCTLEEGFNLRLGYYDQILTEIEQSM